MSLTETTRGYNFRRDPDLTARTERLMEHLQFKNHSDVIRYYIYKADQELEASLEAARTPSLTVDTSLTPPYEDEETPDAELPEGELPEEDDSSDEVIVLIEEEESDQDDEAEEDEEDEDEELEEDDISEEEMELASIEAKTKELPPLLYGTSPEWQALIVAVYTVLARIATQRGEPQEALSLWNRRSPHASASTNCEWLLLNTRRYLLRGRYLRN